MKSSTGIIFIGFFVAIAFISPTHGFGIFKHAGYLFGRKSGVFHRPATSEGTNCKILSKLTLIINNHNLIFSRNTGIRAKYWGRPSIYEFHEEILSISLQSLPSEFHRIIEKPLWLYVVLVCTIDLYWNKIWILWAR